MKAIIYVTLLACCIGACVEPFQPEVGEYDSTLVVDGIFSNSDEPSIVLLSRSFAYADDQGPPIEGAQLMIEDDQGNSTSLTETQAGVYETNPATFKGQIGRSYRLLILTPEGEAFESDWEIMKAAPPIESVRSQFEERIPDDALRNPVPGMQFLVSTKDPENNTQFYHWEFVETYEYGLRYPAIIEVAFGDRPGRGDDEVSFVKLEDYEGFRCWKTEKSTRILIASTENRTEDIIEDFPIHFVSNITPRLYRRYSLLVKQYAVSKANYEYLRIIKETNQTTGSLFDPIPNELFGNIKNSSGKDIPVLGYFSVAGVSTSRTFVDRTDLPLGVLVPFGPECPLDTIPLNFGSLYNQINFNNKILFNYEYSLTGNPINYILTRPECAECSALEATNVRPDFW